MIVFRHCVTKTKNMKKIILITAICGAYISAMGARYDVKMNSNTQLLFQDDKNKQDNRTSQDTIKRKGTQGTQGKQDDKTTQNKNKQNVQVPENIRTTFNNSYPNTNATWSFEGKNYVATYKDTESNMGRVVVYDKDGNIVRTESEMDQGYPEGIGNYYNEKYPNEKKFTVWQSDEGNKRSYYTKRKGKKMRFDQEGKFMKGSDSDKTKMQKDSKNTDNNSNQDNMKK